MKIETTCPFCKILDKEEQAILRTVAQYPWEKQPHNVWNVACSCGAAGPTGSTPEEAVYKWNKRRRRRRG